MYDQVLVSVFLGAACMVVYLEFLRETAVHEKPAEAHRFAVLVLRRGGVAADGHPLVFGGVAQLVGNGHLGTFLVHDEWAGPVRPAGDRTAA